MSDDLSKRIAALQPEQRALLELQLKNRARALKGDAPAPPPQREAVARPDAAPAAPEAAAAAGMQFSLMFFSDNGSSTSPDKYRLLLETARFADSHDFTAVWTPERHFNTFGGLYPNPSTMAAALAMITRRVELRAGSVVLPLQNPLRVAEEWSLVDNLSGGRAGVAFASGWHPDDFVLAPETYADRRDEMFRRIETVKRLWRGEEVSLPNGKGREIAVRVYPNPIQRELPIWITATSEETMVKAGEIGAHVLTGLMEQGVEGCAQKIRAYRESLARHGHAPESGRVTLMLHTLVGPDLEEVKEVARAPFCNYLRTFLLMSEKEALSGVKRDIDELVPKEDQEALLNYSFERYYNTSALLGTPQTCRPLIGRLRSIGVDEVACLLDFGVESGRVLRGLEHLNVLRQECAAATPARAGEA